MTIEVSAHSRCQMQYSSRYSCYSHRHCLCNTRSRGLFLLARADDDNGKVSPTRFVSTWTGLFTNTALGKVHPSLLSVELPVWLQTLRYDQVRLQAILQCKIAYSVSLTRLTLCSKCGYSFTSCKLAQLRQLHTSMMPFSYSLNSIFNSAWQVTALQIGFCSTFKWYMALLATLSQRKHRWSRVYCTVTSVDVFVADLACLLMCWPDVWTLIAVGKHS